ncbi:hypothetical protein JHK87_005831 [Glycine soja]|nr:hypothetical protein JHK87_005831 [Glycine soja]
MDPALRAQLILQCWPNFTVPESRVYLDQYTWMAFDNEFYNQIRLKKGCFTLTSNWPWTLCPKVMYVDVQGF